MLHDTGSTFTVRRGGGGGGTYPLQQISSFLREVGREVEFTLQDLVNRLFPVFTRERRLRLTFVYFR